MAVAALMLSLAGNISLNAAQDGRLGLRTVCIDAGHGGTDPGCVSKDKKTYESKIALDVAKRLSDKIKAGFPDVKVVMTLTRSLLLRDEPMWPTRTMRICSFPFM